MSVLEAEVRELEYITKQLVETNKQLKRIADTLEKIEKHGIIAYPTA